MNLNTIEWQFSAFNFEEKIIVARFLMKSAWLLWHWSRNELTIESGLESTNIIRSMNNNHNFFEENIRRRHLQQYEIYGHGHKQMAVSSAIELTTNLKCLWPNTRAYAMHLRLNWTRAKIRMKIAWRNGALERKPHIITLRSIHFDQSLRLASPSQSFEKEKKTEKVQWLHQSWHRKRAHYLSIGASPQASCSWSSSTTTTAKE